MLLISMKKQGLNLKLDADILSSRMGSEVSSSRSMFHVGEPAIYIPPKQIPDENSFPESYVEASKQHSLQAICINSKQSAPQIPESNTKFTRFHHFGVTLIEGIIFCGFLMGSFRQPQFLKWIDVGANVLCAIKIVLMHIYIFIHNRNKQDEDKVEEQKDRLMYLNNLQMSQLLQIGSILFTFFMCLFPNNEFALTIISIVRLLRLFFPFLGSAQKQSNKDTAWHLTKIVICIMIALIMVAIALQLLLYNIDNYYCISAVWMKVTTQGDFTFGQPTSCGVNLACPTEALPCNNIYAFSNNPHDKAQIRKWVQQSTSNGSVIDTFSHDLFASLRAIANIGGTSYARYSSFMLQEILFPLFLLSWLIYFILPALGLAEALRQFSMSKYMKGLLKKCPIPNTPTVCYLNTTDQLTIVEYCAEAQKIRKELLDRTPVQKILTILFHLLYLSQVFLIIFFNLRLTGQTNAHRDIGVALGVIFILWSFGLGLAFHEWLSDPDRWQNKVKTYTILYQLLAYILSACDYLLKIFFQQYLFESSTQLTPFSHAVLSMRILFILYNNGFDSGLSFITEKIMANFARNALAMGLVITTVTVLGLAASYWLEAMSIQDQIMYIVLLFGRMLGAGIPGHSPQLESGGIIIMLIGIFVYVSLMASIVDGYSSIFYINYDENQDQVAAKEENPLQNQQLSKCRQYLQDLHQSDIYRNFKTVLVISYVFVGLIFKLENFGSNLYLLCVDWFLLLDTLSKLYAFGLAQTPKGPFAFVMISSLISIILFFVRDLIHPGFLIFVHASRCLLLLDLVSSLSQTFQELIASITHPKLNTFKFLGQSSCLVLSVACLISVSIGNSTEYKSTSDLIKFIDLLGRSVGFVYGLKWVQESKNTTVLLCLQIMQVSFVWLFHGIFTYLFLSYFMHLKRSEANVHTVIARISSLSVSSRSLFGSTYLRQYIQVVKVIILLLSFGLLGSLSGSLIEQNPIRHHAATANLTLHIIEIFIYFMENLIQPHKTVFKMEGILLAVSLPGSFFLIFPIIKFTGYVELAILIRVFLGLSVLRILRLYPLLTNHSVSVLSSQIFRRIKNQFLLSELVNILVVWILFTIPFAACQSSISNSSTLAQFINFITGSSLSMNNLRPTQFLLKAIYTIFAHFPIRIILISKIIANFLPLDSNSLPMTILQDPLCQTINELATPTQSLRLILPLCSVYRFCARVDRIFGELMNEKKRMKCAGYGQILQNMKGSEIAVYSLTETESNPYCVLVQDMVNHFAARYLCMPSSPGDSQQKDKNKSRSQGIIKSHFTIWQYWCWRGIKNKIIMKLAKRQGNLPQLHSDIAI